ncbi:hypothetical protein [Phaeovulum sp.]
MTQRLSGPVVVTFEIGRNAVADWSCTQDGVQRLHDLHIWLF